MDFSFTTTPSTDTALYNHLIFQSDKDFTDFTSFLANPLSTEFDFDAPALSGDVFIPVDSFLISVPTEDAPELPIAQVSILAAPAHIPNVPAPIPNVPAPVSDIPALASLVKSQTSCPAFCLPDPVDGSLLLWASRNPTKAVQAPRFRASASLTDAAKATCSLKAKARQYKKKDFGVDFALLLAQHDTLISDLAQRHSMTVDYVSRQVNASTNYKKHCEPNIYNALVHETGKEMNEGQSIGDQYSLAEIQAKVKEDGGVLEPSSSQRNQLLVSLEETRVLKTISLGQHTVIQGLAIFVKGHNHDSFLPSFLECKNSSMFFLEVIGINIFDLMAKFEQWSCNPGPENLQSLQTEVKNLVLSGLEKSVGKKGLAMNYANYNKAIMLKYHVEFLGWPVNIPFANPSKIGTTPLLRTLCDALHVGTCSWQTMSMQRRQKFASEQRAGKYAGELPKKKCKTRSDKNKTHLKKSNKAAETMDKDDNEDKDEDEENQEEDEEDKDKPPWKKHRGPTKPQAASMKKAAPAKKAAAK
ncbi:hypothetical protein B0H34DRAFT_801142 [Crassisporium funariophilum]|nr:hypothetical protein B0H34DRAFT_801142 [Crassisporium funariophilum]